MFGLGLLLGMVIGYVGGVKLARVKQEKKEEDEELKKEPGVVIPVPGEAKSDGKLESPENPESNG